MRKLDPFLLSLVGTVAFATLWPCSGEGVRFFNRLTTLCIAVMFFLQGVRLEPSNVVENLRDWRLQSCVLLISFGLFPLLGLGLHFAFPRLVSTPLWGGFLFLCCLPSTVQSSIALTSIARGNISAAICAATLSNLVGIIATPLLVSSLLHRAGAWSFHTLVDIAGQILLPFFIGQCLHTRLRAWATRRKTLLSLCDRGSIILVVYTAFSQAVLEGLWHRVSLGDLAILCALNVVTLALILVLTQRLGSLCGFSNESVISLMLCGSKKSLATGVPMASILFPNPQVGLIVLPLMLFHQIQLFICTALARHFSKRP